MPVGTRVSATAPGTVVRSDRSASFGNVVIIDHGKVKGREDHVYTLYAHGSSLEVKVGQKVETGDMVIKSGNTGHSTGPHLHYEVIVTPLKVGAKGFYQNTSIRHSPTDLKKFLRK